MRDKFLITTVAAAFGLSCSTGIAAETRSPGVKNAPSTRAAMKRSGAAPQALIVRNSELTFGPITPCRAFAAQTITAATTKTFQIIGAGLGAQGGPGGGCGVPPWATAVTINLTAGNTSYPGYLTAYAEGATRPAITSLTLQRTNTTTGTVIALGSTGAISIYSSKTATVFGDVTGFFALPIQANINADGSIASSTSRVLGTEVLGEGSYVVTVDVSVRYCAISAFAVFPEDAVVTGNADFDGFNRIYFYAVRAHDNSPVLADFSFSVRC